MSGDGNTKHTEDYLTLHPWSGDNGSHEDWEKVLSLKALSLGGNIMYQWVRGEGPEITPRTGAIKGAFLTRHDRLALDRP